MANEAYRKQVSLLVSVLPEIAKEKCFALHGGTAINLFVRDMPRLSVDIDLTYIPIEDRTTSLSNIAAALERIKSSIEKILPNVRITHKKDTAKLQVSSKTAIIKVEVNLVGRGIISEPVEMQLCDKAQNEFEAFCTIQVVPLSQLYGGKICAALDRQHPRDLFDVKYLLENEGLSEEVKKGLLLAVLCSDRPLHELLNPNFQDQSSALNNQFLGMTEEGFSYEEYEAIRTNLVKAIHENLTEEDKQFLLNFTNLNPDWNKYDFAPFPAIIWKLQNLQKLKDNNPEKHLEQFKALKKLLDNM